jgi:hypothetical protein
VHLASRPSAEAAKGYACTNGSTFKGIRYQKKMFALQADPQLKQQQVMLVHGSTFKGILYPKNGRPMGHLCKK